MSYEVEIEGLRTAATSAGSAADQVREASPGSALSGVSSALPGSGAAGVVTSVRIRWGSRFGSWATGADDYATGLRDNATTYEASDASAAEAFGG